MKPLILISNDDGIDAPGLRALAGGVADLGEILVAAPDRERSATGHAFSLNAPLRADEREPGWWAISGTPADCVYLGVLQLAERAPALVISGINHGYNLGTDFYYSGTVAAAVEGCLRGIPSFAISLQRGPREGLTAAARAARVVAGAILRNGLPPKTLLNVNVPNTAPLRGYAWTRLGERVYRDTVEVREDLRGRRYYWIGGPEADAEDGPDADGSVVKEGKVSITPLQLDLTCKESLAAMAAWQLEGFEGE